MTNVGSKFSANRSLKAAIVDMHQSLPRPYADPTDDCDEMNRRSQELGKQLRSYLSGR